jgi:hypothetical protein
MYSSESVLLLGHTVQFLLSIGALTGKRLRRVEQYLAELREEKTRRLDKAETTRLGH